jgi:hypothetical protein
MTFHIAGVMTSVILAIAIVAGVAFAVDIFDLEHEPVGIALIALTSIGATAFVVARMRPNRRALGSSRDPAG